MKKLHPKKTTLTAAVTAAFISGSVASVLAGEVAKAPAVAATPAAANPLSLAGGVLTFDFQERIRWEARANNFDFDSTKSAANKTDDDWGLNRLRLGLMVKPTSWFKFYVQGQDVREFNSDRTGLGTAGSIAEGDNAFDIRQAYVELADYKKCPWGLKIGRQVLAYGDERLVGAFEWGNFARTFDAAKLTYKGKGFSVDAFTSSVVVPKATELDQSDIFNAGELSRSSLFSGVYLTFDSLPFGALDFYVFQLDAHGTTKTTGAVPGTSVANSVVGNGQNTDFTTLGTRIKGDPKKLHGWEYTGEFAYETGTVQGLSLSAYAISAGGGYNFNAPLKPRLYGELNYASGDKSGTDTNLETFQNLFPTNHKFYGAMDAFSLQNLQNALVSFRVSPTKTVTAQLDYNAFWAAENTDKMYRANGTAGLGLGAAKAGSKYAGSELDAIVTWNAKKYLQIQAGYCYFIPGSYIQTPAPSTAGHSDASFAYLQAMVTF